MEQAKRLHEEAETEFWDSDKVENCTEIGDRLKTCSEVPNGFSAVRKEEFLALCYIEFDDENIPMLKGSITIHESMDFTVVCLGKPLAAEIFADIVDAKIGTMSQVKNLMAHLKSLITGDQRVPWMMLAIDCLERAKGSDDCDDVSMEKITFLLEQLKLVGITPKRRRYCPSLLLTAYLLHASSPNAYHVLKEAKSLTLPSETTLWKLTRHVGAPIEDGDAYLQLRFEKLPQPERVVNLLIDEIYVKKKVEYTSGEFTGLTPTNATASTVLSFMVSSTCSKYRDIVAFYPISGLTAEKLHKCFMEVLERLCQIGFHVLSVITDNLATNRRFFSEFLCGGTLNCKISNPVTGKPLFLILDPVHNFKNVYNNWEKKKLFQYPAFPPYLTDCTATFKYVQLLVLGIIITFLVKGVNLCSEDEHMFTHLPFLLVSSLLCFNFSDLCDLFEKEGDKPVKLAYKLNVTALHPTSVQKTSVKWATAVFHESTCKALEA